MLRQGEGINKYAKERKHMAIRGNEGACKGKECTLNSNSSSNMRRVAKVSSLCLDYQEKKMNKHAYGLAAGKTHK